MRHTATIAAFVLYATGLCAERHDTLTWLGVMVDAGCRDRSLENLLAPPTESLAVKSEPQKPARGITVSPQVLKAERADAILPDTLDHASRYSSASCALTADTKAFALVGPNGLLLELDEGGNTLAFDAFESTPAGAAILNGKVGGIKPVVKVTGLQAGRRIKVQSVVFMRPPAR
jgi:hypothetical protein